MRLRIVVLALLVLPSLASAQRRQRGEPEANWRDVDQFARSTAPLSVRDVENLSAVKVLIDERKKLKLSDEQTKLLRAIAEREKEENRPAFRAVDSLRKIARARPTAMSDEEQARMSVARLELRSVIDSVRARFGATLAEAQALLDDTQRAAAAEFIAKHDAESTQMLRDKFAEMSQVTRPATGGAGRRP